MLHNQVLGFNPGRCGTAGSSVHAAAQSHWIKAWLLAVATAGFNLTIGRRLAIVAP